MSMPAVLFMAEVGLKAVFDERLFRAAEIWDRLVGLRPDNIYINVRCWVHDSCTLVIGLRKRRKYWTDSMDRAVTDNGIHAG